MTIDARFCCQRYRNAKSAIAPTYPMTQQYKHDPGAVTAVLKADCPKKDLFMCSCCKTYYKRYPQVNFRNRGGWVQL
ncbi:hypothetical protein I5R65_07650 [Herbaspirillum sp. AP02]|uniref:hypothetical protein n=1 Tax=unclassified Herbaspirillum TaxID=2624150 RepID=UPI0015DAC6A0|nr:MULTISPECIES: hypothetical protein [unclassified Herbaspirillum]MBG7619334.1 hypothetical protein [Herbaspirillum sp. AP02]NZD66618.1 hypothetical protein [Herbaspirillum sp. AP21]